MRVLFVGMNNKPGFAPLDSQTKSGKLIDRVIAQLSDYTCVKSNLYDMDHFPLEDKGFNYDWANRVEYSGEDIIVALGACVQERFRKSPFKFVSIGHPSAVWSREKQEQYVKNALSKIKNAEYERVRRKTAAR